MRERVTVRENDYPVDEPGPPGEAVRQRIVVHDDAASEVNDQAVYSDGAVAQERMVVRDPAAARDLAAERLRQIIWLVFGIISGLIVLRIVLRALGANPDAGFATFIYGITGPLVAPFVNLFQTPRSDGMVLELGTFVALLFYLLLGWVVAKLAVLASGRY